MSTILENAFGVIIGVGNDLPLTVNDATAIYNILVDPEMGGYKKENLKLVTETEATRDGILKALEELKTKTNKESTVFIYYSGHGGYYEPWDQYYLVPHNFDGDNPEATWVKAEELKQILIDLDTDKLIFMLDSCHAAGMTKEAPSIGEEAPPPAPEKDLKKANDDLRNFILRTMTKGKSAKCTYGRVNQGRTYNHNLFLTVNYLAKLFSHITY